MSEQRESYEPANAEYLLRENKREERETPLFFRTWTPVSNPAWPPVLSFALGFGIYEFQSDNISYGFYKFLDIR